MLYVPSVKPCRANRRYADRLLELVTDTWEYRFYSGTGDLYAQLVVQVSAPPQCMAPA